jgi:hypothetical protein
MLDQIPTEVTNHSKARTDGVSSSDVLASPQLRYRALTYRMPSMPSKSAS